MKFAILHEGRDTGLVFFPENYDDVDEIEDIMKEHGYFLEDVEDEEQKCPKE